MTYMGETYEGDWYKNKRTGKGKMTFLDNEVYEGEFDENVMNGEGVMYFANGDTYKGTFADGVRHGEGIMTLNSGESFSEIWEHGLNITAGPVGDNALRHYLRIFVNQILDLWDISNEVVKKILSKYDI